MVTRTWRVAPLPGAETVAELAARLDVPPLLARCLIRRGLSDPDQATRFLEPGLGHLHDPDRFLQMGPACERIWRAVERQERILIAGDYDADGITSTAVLLDFFGLIEYPVRWYIPDRVVEGFSLGPALLERAAAEKIGLCITVDNGIGAVAEVAELKRLGCDVIVTDHHEPGPELPPALATIAPKAPGETYPFKGMAGVGIAFKLAWGLARRFTGRQMVAPAFRRFLLEAMGLVALGTVADVAPLVDENRVLVLFGLRALNDAGWPGLHALRAVSRADKRALGAWDLAFRLAPRINAAGRMGSAEPALELLRCRDPIRAGELARELDRANLERQRIERRILQEASGMLAEEPALLEDPLIVLGSPSWHPGVIGIVASRLLEEHQRPIILVALQGPIGRGSARSPAGFPIHRCLAEVGDLLLSHGGHPRAAGFKLAAERFPALRPALVRAARAMATERPALDLDAEVRLEEITSDLVTGLERLGPHGEENPPPLFAGHGLTLAGHSRLCGYDSQDLSFLVRQGSAVHRAVIRKGARAYGGTLTEGSILSLAFTPRRSPADGEIELYVKDMGTYPHKT